MIFVNVLGFPHTSQPGPVATVANSTGHCRPWHRCPLSHGSLHTVIIVIIVIYLSYAFCTFVIIPKKVNCVNCLGIFGTSVWHFSCWAQNLRTCMRQQSFIIFYRGSVPCQTATKKKSEALWTRGSLTILTAAQFLCQCRSASFRKVGRLQCKIRNDVRLGFWLLWAPGGKHRLQRGGDFRLATAGADIRILYIIIYISIIYIHVWSCMNIQRCVYLIRCIYIYRW